MVGFYIGNARSEGSEILPHPPKIPVGLGVGPRFKKLLFKILKHYFKSAFTIIVKKRRLCPGDAFRTVTALGVKVPKFIHPASLEYVNEVSKKLILMMCRNVTEGCVLHVMIEKNKTLHVVQRFVFRTVGSFDFSKLLERKNDVEDAYDLNEIRERCGASLLQMLNSDLIKPISIPQFSRWSISIGLKDEFVSMVDEESLKSLWYSDPSGNYFPWKNRPRNLPSSNASQKDPTERKPNIPGNSSEKDLSKRKEPPAVSEMQTGTDDQIKECVVIRPTEDMSAAQSSKHESNDGKTDGEQTSHGIICFPVSSFPVGDGLVLSVYGLEYPAPPFPPIAIPEPYTRNVRTPPNVAFRVSQIRHRVFKNAHHSNN